MAQRVLFTTYFMDRQISLTVGRPYGMRWEDIAVAQPPPLDDTVSNTAPLA